MLRKHGDRLVVTRHGDIIQELPIEKVDAVVLFSGTHVTTPCLECLLEKGIHTTFLSKRGKFYGRLESTRHVNVKLQLMQIERMQTSDFSLKLARRFILAKIRNQAVILRRYNRNDRQAEVENACTELEKIIKNLEGANDHQKLLGLEGQAARIYFSALGRFTDNGYIFVQRTKQPPCDPFNALLSFGYTLLLYEIYTVLQNRGLHPYFGYLHSPNQGHPALASDLIEEWRPVLIDSLVMKIVRGNEIKITEFNEPNEDGGVYLSKEGARKFIRKFMQRMAEENKYVSRDGFGRTFRDGISIQVARLIDAIETGDADKYQPVIIR